MSISDPTLGEISMFGANWAPRGWALCQGQLLPINQNQALFSIIGTIYGGDGRTTFGLPDFRGRSPRGQGTGPGFAPVMIGQRSGRENETLSVMNMPNHSHPHTHTASVHGEARLANEAAPTDNVFALANANIYHDVDSGQQDVLMHANTVTLAQDATPAGGSQSFSLMNPYIGVNFIIALTGVYPSRS